MDDMVFRQLSYGLYAIGVADGQRPTGCIVNTVFQVTSENPIIAISMNKSNYTYSVIERTKSFTISILSESTDPKVITALGFQSGCTKDKFQDLNYKMLSNGLPILEEACCGYLVCQLADLCETSTHFVILGQVVDTLSGTNEPPMTYKYYHEVIKGKAPKNAPTYQASYDQPSVATSEPTSEHYVCTVCGYIYDGDLTQEPDDFKCPICGVQKSLFIKQS